jgi:raffinose/stachyose/melibiose transport system substrate-binding protein
MGRFSRGRHGAIVAAATVLLATLAVTAAGAAGGGPVTITMLAYFNEQPGLQVLISNFERVDPNAKVEVSYAPSTTVLYQLEETELAGGSGPDLLTTYPGCGTPVSLCALVQAGYLAPMLNAPWLKRTVPLVLARDKVGAGLYAFTPEVSPYGVFTNDSLFRKLGLAVPQTFAELLTFCAKAHADGVVPLDFPGGGGAFARLADALAMATVYGSDPNWLEQLKAGKTSFEGSAGWHQALDESVQLDDSGCFQAGVAGTSSAAAIALFAQGQSLMYADTSTQKGAIDAADPGFDYSFRPFPASTAADQTRAFLNLNFSASIDARASAADQAAALSFVDFIARPAQDALYAQIEGGLTQYGFLQGELPGFMSSFGSVFAAHQYVVNPEQTWQNAEVDLTLNQDGVGLLTGQSTVSGVLNATDAAWDLGPT